MSSLMGPRAPVVEVPEARHHVMLDQPLAFIAALRMLLDGWMRNESAKGSGPPRAWRDNGALPSRRTKGSNPRSQNLLSRTIDDDRYPLSPRIQSLKGVLATLRPEPVRERLCGSLDCRASCPARGDRGSPGTVVQMDCCFERDATLARAGAPNPRAPLMTAGEDVVETFFFHHVQRLLNFDRAPSVTDTKVAISSPARGRFCGKSGSHQTLPWREPDSNLYGAFPVKWSFLVCCRFFVRSWKSRSSSRRLRSGSRSARKGSRDRNGSTAWRLAG